MKSPVGEGKDKLIRFRGILFGHNDDEMRRYEITLFYWFPFRKHVSESGEKKKALIASCSELLAGEYKITPY